MTSWRPQTELEEDIVALQPECNFIYGNLTDAQKKLQNHSRPRAHLDHLNIRSQEDKDDDGHLKGLHAIRAVHRITYSKPLGMPNDYEELNNLDNLHLETTAMIRKCGMGPTMDHLGLSEATTIPTLPISQELRIVQNGRDKLFPVIRDDNFFGFVSTRMRNAKFMKNIQFMRNDIKGLPQEKEGPNLQNISVLNEDEVKEPTEADIAAENLQKYLEAYPKVCESKTKMSSNNKYTKKTEPKATKNKKAAKQTNSKAHGDASQQNSKSESSVSLSSNSSGSLYESFGPYDSCNSSAYFSAIDSPSLNSQSFSEVVQSNGKSNKENTIKNNSYTPKELYNMKRHP